MSGCNRRRRDAASGWRRGTWRSRHASSRRMRWPGGDRSNDPRWGRSGVQRNRRDVPAGCAGNFSRRRPNVPRHSPLPGCGMRRLRNRKCNVHLSHRQRISTDLRFDQIPRWHKDPRGLIRVVSDGDARRRHRRPAHVAAPIAPFYPCRCPGGARQPDPTQSAVAIPSPIVEGSPTPNPLGLEAPAGVRVHPIPARHVGLEFGADDPWMRPPDSPNVLHDDPFSIRRQGVVEHADLRRWGPVDHRPGMSGDNATRNERRDQRESQRCRDETDPLCL